jgi:hypothetical protein
MGDIELVKNRILSSNALFIAHPGNAKLSEFYPNASNVTSHVAEALNQHGSYRVSFNQRQFGGSSTAIVSTSSLLNNFAIAFSILPGNANTVGTEDGWGFEMIQTVQFSFSNSLMQDVAIPGPLLKEYALYLCKDESERSRLLRAAGSPFAGVVTARSAIVPLNFLSFIGTTHAFPLDLSVLSSGTVQIRVTLKPADQVFQNNAAAALNANLAIDQMDIIASTSVLLQSAFSVRNAMIESPEMIYSLPSKYLNFYTYAIAAATNPYIAPNQTLQLSSVPSGQLEAMFVCIRRNRDNPNPQLTSPLYDNAVSFDYLKLTYGAQTIYESRTFEERCYYLKSVFDDDLQYTTDGFKGVAAEALPFLIETSYDADRQYQCCVIPFMHKGASTKSGAFMENLPTYGGSQLSLEYRLRAPRHTEYWAVESANGLPANATNRPSKTEVVAGNAANGHTIYIGYLMSSILMISNGVIDLQL